MNDLAKIIGNNKKDWDSHVDAGEHCTVPWLNIDMDLLSKYAYGDLLCFHKPNSKKTDNLFLAKIRKLFFTNLKEKKVLCLASGGGQQSAMFSLLGADVTVADISQGQLDGDIQAAVHYGYTIKTVQCSMTDLSVFEDESFDIVFQPISICFVPDVSVVYKEVYRVLKKGGLYQVHHTNPAILPTSFENDIDGWDGTGYRISSPYVGGALLTDENGNENMSCGEPTGEFRHLFIDMFCHLTEAGFQIKYVMEDERNLFDDILEQYRLNSANESYDSSFSILQRYIYIISSK